MIPNIPDNFYKILLAVGIFLLGYSYLQVNRSQDNYKTASRSFDLLKDSLNDMESKRDVQAKSVITSGSDLAMEYGVKNPIVDRDTDILFTERYETPELTKVTRLMKVQWDKLTAINSKLESTRQRIDKKLDLLNEDLSEANTTKSIWYVAAEFGFFAVIIGGAGLFRLQILQDRLLEKQVFQGEKFTRCQSCAKLFNAAVQHAKYADGEVNNYYCSTCFKDGNFSDKNLDINSVILAYCSSKNLQSRREIKSATKTIREMQRWKAGEY